MSKRKKNIDETPVYSLCFIVHPAGCLHVNATRTNENWRGGGRATDESCQFYAFAAYIGHSGKYSQTN